MYNVQPHAGSSIPTAINKMCRTEAALIKNKGSDKDRNSEDDVEYYYYEESSEEEEMLSAEDRRLFDAVIRNDAEAAAAVQQAIQDGANVNAVRFGSTTDFRKDKTPLFEACEHGKAEIVGILLDAGADARWKNDNGWLAIVAACYYAVHLSTVQLLINHDIGLLEIADKYGYTPLLYAVQRERSDIVRFLLDSGADAHHVDQDGETALMHACQCGHHNNVRLLMDAGVDVEVCDNWQRTALHHAAVDGDELMLELILQHNANMFVVDEDGRTPFDEACSSEQTEQTVDVIDRLLEIYGNKLTQDHGRFALHELLSASEYSFAEDEEFRPPLNPLRTILPLGELTLKHWRTLLYTLDPEMIRNRDDIGKMPIHIACQTNAPVEVLALILELDPTGLHIADSTGALPIHLLCATTAAPTEYASVRYLVEQGGVGTLAARNRQGFLPLHVLCGSTNPPLRSVQYLIQSFPVSLAMQTNAGHYPFMVAAAADSSLSLTSLSVIYELVRANPGLINSR